jgi:hypothetical protein
MPTKMFGFDTTIDRFRVPGNYSENSGDSSNSSDESRPGYNSTPAAVKDPVGDRFMRPRPGPVATNRVIVLYILQ